MKVYMLNANANKYKNLVLRNESDADILLSFTGASLVKGWRPLRVTMFTNDHKNRNLPISDFPAFVPHIPVFSKKAVDALADLLNNNGELLPLECTEGDYSAYNVTKIVDCLNEDCSEISRFKSTHKIMEITKYCFYKNAIGREGLFRLPQVPLWGIFVNEEFVERVLKQKLVGFRFDKIWEE